VTFQENLGSMYDKTLRLVAIAEFFADRLLSEPKNRILRAARFAKADLITGVVREFPELQGIMGKYYALHNGEGREVAEALEEQYLPAHSGGALPRTDAGAVISMADKIDSIAAFFSIGLVPTGSEDPFALRRQALGIIAILFDKGYALPLDNIIETALGVLSNVSDYNGTRDAIHQFFKVRLETVLSDKGYSNDLIQSILPLSLGIELKDIVDRLDAVSRFREDSRCDAFLSAVKRVYNILPKTAVAGLRNELLYEESEKELKANIDSAREQLPALLDNRKYHDAILMLSNLTGYVNTFFDTVLVMDKREEVKQNRFSLLKELWDTLSIIADFSKLAASQ
jgi:glycyl-tRNA synthetase beta chain